MNCFIFAVLTASMGITPNISNSIVISIWMVMLFSFNFSSNFRADAESGTDHSIVQLYEQIAEADSHDDGTDEDQIILLTSKDCRPVNRERIFYWLQFNHFVYSKPPMLPPEFFA